MGIEMPVISANEELEDAKFVWTFTLINRLVRSQPGQEGVVLAYFAGFCRDDGGREPVRGKLSRRLANIFITPWSLVPQEEKSMEFTVFASRWWFSQDWTPEPVSRANGKIC